MRCEEHFAQHDRHKRPQGAVRQISIKINYCVVYLGLKAGYRHLSPIGFLDIRPKDMHCRTNH